MGVKELLAAKNIGFIGMGNLAQSLVSAFISSGTLRANQIWATNRSEGKLKKVSEQFSIHPVKNNEELLDQCDLVFICVKPQDLTAAVGSISSCFNEAHLVISLAAGISLRSLGKLLPGVKQLGRVMTNTPARIGQGVVGYCLAEEASAQAGIIEHLFGSVGYVVPVEEGDAFEALTVATSSGIGFVLEIMQIWQEWLEEHGFEDEEARAMTTKTFLGATQLADGSKELPFEELQNRVVSKKGVTAAGLDSMREMELDRILRYSFEKAVLRDRELGKIYG